MGLLLFFVILPNAEVSIFLKKQNPAKIAVKIVQRFATDSPYFLELKLHIFALFSVSDIGVPLTIRIWGTALTTCTNLVLALHSAIMHTNELCAFLGLHMLNFTAI